MSVRVRFSSARPGVAYVSPPGEQDNTDGALVTEILSKPMPPLHQEDNFRMDAHTAASIGDVAVIHALIASKKLDPNAKNLSEWTPLLYAAYLGHHNVCTALIDAGAKLDDCNLKGQTALMMASACGNLQVVRLLLERGASVNRADSQDRQALHYSSSCSQNVVTDALLQAGADPNAPDIEGMTPMLEACSSGHELTICSLLEYGGDPLLRNCRGEDCQALAGEDPKIQQLLMDNIKRRSSSGFNNESPRTRRPRTLDDLLEGMNLSRLSEKFKSENIDLNLFFDLTEKDFEEMGIAYGPKKRMLTVIDQYRKSGQISYEPLEVELAHSPTFTAATKDGGHKEMVSSMQYIRQMNDMTKQYAMEALEAARRSSNGDVQCYTKTNKPGLSILLSALNLLEHALKLKISSNRSKTKRELNKGLFVDSRLRPLIIGIINSVENITTRIARHHL